MVSDSHRGISPSRPFPLRGDKSFTPHPSYGHRWSGLWRDVDDIQLLELYVSRSQSLRLSLELRISLSPSESQLSGGSQTLSRAALRSKSSILVNFGVNSSYYLSTLELPFLERLGLVNIEHVSIPRLGAANAPVLQHLSLKARSYFNGFLFEFDFPWSSIISLRLEQISTNICLQALESCQNLVEFRCRADIFTYWSSGDHHEFDIVPILPHLKLFHSSLSSEIILSLLGKLQAPVLQFLELDDELRDGQDWVDISKICPRLCKHYSSAPYQIGTTGISQSLIIYLNTLPNCEN